MTYIADPAVVVPQGIWALDPVHSSAGFAVKHMAVGTFRGRFEDFDATLSASEDGEARLIGVVKADSIVVKDPNLAGHLKSPDFFDTELHPEIRFESSSLRRDGERLVADGELTINGNTHPVEARGTITEPHVGLGDVEKVGLTLEAVVDRTLFGLNWNAPLPKGGFALGNDVTLLVELELARVEA
jgi:polyisoprenoid-binding protein YceI